MAQKNTGSKTAVQATDKTSKDSNKEEPSYLEKFFTDQLKDIYYAENKILEGLKKMIESATTDELKDAFKEHLGQTEKHVKRLEKSVRTAGQKTRGQKM